MEWFKEMNVVDATDFDKLVLLKEVISDKTKHPNYYLKLKGNEERAIYYHYRTDCSEGLQFKVGDLLKARSIKRLIRHADSYEIKAEKYTGLLKIPKYFADYQAFTKQDFSAKKKSRQKMDIEA